MNKKLNVMSHRPGVSDDEIKSYMDFDSVLNKRNEMVKTIRRTSLIKKSLIALISGVIVLSAIWFFLPDRSPKQNIVRDQKPSVENIPPVVDSAVVDQNKVTENQDEVLPRRIVQEKSQDKTTAKPPAEENTSQEQSYIQAEPVNGYDELYAYFNKSLVYPKDALKDSVQGVVTIAFIVNRDGKPEKIEFINSLGPALDSEAKRLIENMPEWKPATLNGKAVPSKISLPITFQIQKLHSH